MNFLELAKDRYSVRSYKPDMIEEEKLAYILEAGRLSPTACNFQQQKIFVIKKAEILEKLNTVCRFTFGAPVVLVIGYDTERDWKNKRAGGIGSGETDVAIVTTHMMLAAWEQGIGSCWVGAFSPDKVSEALGISENIRITALMPLGYPSSDAEPMSLHSEFRDYSDTIEFLDTVE
jgi:nitroreductase